VAVVDTNCSPEGVNHVIPGNDDALRAVRLFASRIADAILEGRQLAEQKEAEEAAAAAEQAKAAGVTIEITPRGQRERGGQPRGERGERRERGGRGRGDRGRGDRRPKKTAPGTGQPAISGVRPSSVEATETVEAVIHPAAGAEAPQTAPPAVETPAPEVEKTPAQDASAA
jgi:hypothetical protein